MTIPKNGVADSANARRSITRNSYASLDRFIQGGIHYIPLVLTILIFDFELFDLLLYVN